MQMPSYMVSLIKFFLSFFSSMDSQAGTLLNSSAISQTSMFLLALRSWGFEFCQTNPDPTAASHFLSQIEVTCIMHNKMPCDPEHEFLVIETLDRLGKVKPLILERTVSGDPNNMDTATTSPGDGFINLTKKIKQITRRHFPGGQQYDLAAAEEGSILPSLSSLSIIDKATVSLTQSADLMSESLKLQLEQLRNSPAIDQFLGENFVFAKRWHGQNIRHMKPEKTLSLYELAILADLVHKEFPKYSILKDQCFFFAALIYSAVEYRFGNSLTSSANLMDETQDLVHIDGSRILSNKFGRWKGALISSVDDGEVLEIVRKYEEEYDSEISKVTLQIFRLQVTHYILHRSRKEHRVS